MNSAARARSDKAGVAIGALAGVSCALFLLATFSDLALCQRGFQFTNVHQPSVPAYADIEYGDGHL